MGITATIITLNEEANIERCLESVSWVDEMIVVDSGSCDRTAEIAGSCGAKVFTREFDGFSRQKGFALEKATQDWVLNIDADEALSVELRQEIRNVIVAGGDICGWWMPRLTTYLGRPIKSCGWYPDRQLRLFRREKARYPERLVHERVEVEGPCANLKGDLLHASYSSFMQHIEKQKSYAFAMAEQMRSEGRISGPVKMAISPALSFFKKYIVERGFTDGPEGFLISSVHAYYVFMKYAQLWDLQRKG